MKVDYLAKSKVSEENFEYIVYDWLSKGDYNRNDIIENIITEHNLMFFPICYFSTSYIGTATVSLDYNRTEYYYVWNETLKNSNKEVVLHTSHQNQ